MDAAILAAGVGSRLRPITIKRPKCCVTVNGSPILSHQLQAYAEAGIDHVYVAAGYMADDVRAVSADVAAEYDDFEVTVRENEAFANTDNLYSLYQLREDLDGEPFILSNGDVVFDGEVLDRLRSSSEGNAIVCDTSSYSEEAMKLRLDETGHVAHISKEIGADTAAAVGVDIYRFTGRVSGKLFNRIEGSIERESGYSDWTEKAIDDLLRRGDTPFEPVDIAGHRWVEIDDLDDLQVADRTFSPLQSFEGKEAVFFDLDGTIYLDDTLVPGAGTVVERLRSNGTDVFFLSNNSSAWKTDYAKKLDELGVPTEPDDIVLSTDGVIDHLVQEGTRSVYVLGTDAMRGAMADHGFELTADDPEAVVVGFDTELTYEKARKATLAIRDGATFLLAHSDTVCPTADGMIPDCGSIGKLVETATGREPEAVFGKPNPSMIAPVLEAEDLRPADIVIVGDRLETEILLAERIGSDSVCVLTGATDRAMIESDNTVPSLILDNVGELVDQGFVSECGGSTPALPSGGPSRPSATPGNEGS